MLAFTTNAEFIKVIEETKPEDRKMKSKEEGKTIKYVFGIGTAVSYKKFMRQLEMSGEEVD
jgi:hypothetical protein